jgi:hypothetical protein
MPMHRPMSRVERCICIYRYTYFVNSGVCLAITSELHETWVTILLWRTLSKFYIAVHPKMKSKNEH